jgi:hypothetical protein
MTSNVATTREEMDTSAGAITHARSDRIGERTERTVATLQDSSNACSIPKKARLGTDSATEETTTQLEKQTKRLQCLLEYHESTLLLYNSFDDDGDESSQLVADLIDCVDKLQELDRKSPRQEDRQRTTLLEKQAREIILTSRRTPKQNVAARQEGLLDVAAAPASSSSAVDTTTRTISPRGDGVAVPTSCVGREEETSSDNNITGTGSFKVLQSTKQNIPGIFRIPQNTKQLDRTQTGSTNSTEEPSPEPLSNNEGGVRSDDDGNLSTFLSTETQSGGKSNDDSALMRKNTTTKLEEARAKLHKAKLHNALASKKRALLLALRKSAKALPPIQALLKGGLDSLDVTNIKSSGPPEKVYFCTTTLLYDSVFEDEDFSSDGSWSESDEEEVTPPKSTNLQDSMALLERRMELQKKIIDAKEKMQRLEKGPPDGEEGKNGKRPSAKVTRQALLKRKEEAERNRALTHYKHLVSKQQHLLEKQQAETKKTEASLRETEREISEIESTKLLKLKENVGVLETRKVVLDGLLVEKLTDLVDLRKRAHDRKNGGVQE